jgi:hypothetical protein
VKQVEIPKLLTYGGEMSRTRYWQEVQLVVIGALISSRPMAPETIDDEAARAIVNAADLIADAALRKHGPSVSSNLQREAPFQAAPGVKGDRDETDEG